MIPPCETFLSPQSSARLFAQKAEPGSAPRPQFIVTAATNQVPDQKNPSLGPDGGEPHVPSICLSSSLFSLGGKLHSHTIKLERSQARQTEAASATVRDQVAEMPLKESCSTPFLLIVKRVAPFSSLYLNKG